MSSPISTKYLDTLLYLLDSDANNEKLGKVKLMKLLYFADFDHFATTGHSITGDTYYKLPYGPVPRLADVAIAELHRQQRIKISQVPVHQYLRNSYQLGDTFYPEKADLDEAERATLDQVIRKWKHHTTQEIVSASHGEPTWQMVEYGEAIPYSYVRYRKQVCVQDEEVGSIMDDGPVTPLAVRVAS